MFGENPAATSFSALADEQLYNQFTPGRRKSDNLLASSSSSSPNLMRSPNRAFSTPYATQKAVTIFDQIVEWFHAEIRQRKHVAAAACAYLSVVIFTLTVSILKLSLWAPFSSLKDALTWWLYPSEWVPIIVIGGVSTASAVFMILQFCIVNQVPKLSTSETLTWIGYVAEFAYRFLFVFTALHVADSSFAGGYAWAVISFAIAVSSGLALFHNDFHLNFTATEVNSLKTFVEFLKSLPYVSIVESCSTEAVVAYTAGIANIVFAGPVFWGFSSWWLLVNIPFHIVLFGACFIQQFYMKLFIRLVNQIVMKPMAFPFPPPYTVHSPTPEQTRTLTNVIDTHDPLLKFFALHDLRTIAWNDEKRRVDVFALSQPGQHPRNWKAVSAPCVRMLDELSSRMTVSAARLVGYSWDDHEGENEEMPRNALMMPRRMREMAFGGAGPSRQQRNMAPIRSQNTQVGGFFARIYKVLGLGPTEKLVITRFDAQLIAYAAEALYMLVVDSLGEDRFGVVQKDLKDLISLLCKLIAAIDTFERARASVADKSDVTYLRIVDSSLKSSLQRVVTAFGGHLRSLNLAEEHVRTIRLVCLIEEL